MAPFPDRLNPISDNALGDIVFCVHLFQRGFNENENTYVSSSSLRSDFKTVSTWIIDSMKTVCESTGGFQAAVVTESTPNPEFQDLEMIFPRDFFKYPPKILIVVAKSIYPNGNLQVLSKSTILTFA